MKELLSNIGAGGAPAVGAAPAAAAGGAAPEAAPKEEEKEEEKEESDEDMVRISQSFQQQYDTDTGILFSGLRSLRLKCFPFRFIYFAFALASRTCISSRIVLRSVRNTTHSHRRPKYHMH